MQSSQVINVAGFPVTRISANGLVDYLETQVRVGGKIALFYANTNFVVRCKPLQESMQRQDVVIVNDGIGLDLAVRMICHRDFPENLAGSDFIPYFFSHTVNPLRLFLLGSKPQILQRAAQFVNTKLGQQVVGTCDGYEGLRNTSDLVERINQSGAQMVLVALGNPIQEEWILGNLHRMQCNIAMGVGALFDFWGGDKPRAPLFMRRLRLEWLFRLCLEPRRLMARYTIDFFRFLLLCHKYR
jgi:beta-1,4-glucosyltransferase